MLNWKEAANFCGLDETYFRNRVKRGTGPAYIRPSPRKHLFHEADLDQWIRTWNIKIPQAPQQPRISAELR